MLDTQVFWRVTSHRTETRRSNTEITHISSTYLRYRGDHLDDVVRVECWGCDAPRASPRLALVEEEGWAHPNLPRHPKQIILLCCFLVLVGHQNRRETWREEDRNTPKIVYSRLVLYRNMQQVWAKEGIYWAQGGEDHTCRTHAPS